MTMRRARTVFTVPLWRRLLYPVVAALTYRTRGGGFVELAGTQAARSVWSVLVAVVVYVHVPAPRWVAPATFVTAFLALVLTGHGEHQDMGRMPVGYTDDGMAYEAATAWLPAYDGEDPFWNKELHDFVAMTVIGTVRGVITMMPVFRFAPRFAGLYVAGSATMGLAYWIGYRMPLSLPALAAHSPGWGELLTGFFIGLALAAHRGRRTAP